MKEGTTQLEETARRKGAWQDQQEDQRVRQVAALRDHQVDEEVPSLTPEVIDLLAGLSGQLAAVPEVPVVVALQLTRGPRAGCHRNDGGFLC